MEGIPFGRYRLITQITEPGPHQGVTAVTEVWRARDTVGGSFVALKRLPEFMRRATEFTEHFHREVDLLQRLRGPHLVPIIAHGEIEGRLFVATQLIPGEDLGEIIARAPLHPAWAVSIIEQTAIALDVMHRSGLVHRSVRPSNIIVAQGGLTYLDTSSIGNGIDAIKYQYVGTEPDSHQSMIRSYYLAREQMLQRGTVDHRADVYALGCVLYECLTGHRPFWSSDVQGLARALSEEVPPPRPSEIRPDLPRAFDEVISRGMAKDARHRYATAPELAEAARASLGR